MKDTYRPGGFYRMCARCGFKKRNWDTVKDWDGLFVCRDTCFDGEHPQDHVKAKADRIRVPDPRPEPTDNFLEDNEITRESL